MWRSTLPRLAAFQLPRPLRPSATAKTSSSATQRGGGTKVAASAPTKRRRVAGAFRRLFSSMRRLVERRRKIDYLALEIDQQVAVELHKSFRSILDAVTVVTMILCWAAVWYGYVTVSYWLFLWPNFVSQEHYDRFFEELHPALLGFGHIMIFAAIYEAFRFVKYPFAKRVMEPFWRSRGWTRISQESLSPAAETRWRGKTNAAAAVGKHRRHAVR